MRHVVLLVLVASALAPSGAAAADDPHLLVRIDNTYEPTELTLSVTDEDDREIFRDDLRAELGLTTIEVPAVEGYHFVGLYVTDPDPLALGAVFGRAFVSQGADPTGCPAATAVDFTIDVAGLGTRGTGCTVLTAEAAALLAEARDAKPGVTRPAFDIPAPGSADRGVMGGRLFEWRGETEFLDAWGRSVTGLEVRYLYTGGSMYSSDALTGAGASVEVGNTMEVYRWLRGETAPHARSRTGGGFGTADAPTASSVTIEREMRYDAWSATFPCGLRNGLQGRTLHPGDTVTSADVCAAWDGPAWRAAAPVTIEGYRLLPLYQLEETPERTVVGRAYLIDGLAYPFAMERYVLPADGFLRRDGTGILQRYEAGGEPIPLDGATAAPPAPALAPLDPLRGPATGDAGALLPFTLADAANAALADPSLRALGDVLTSSDAALIGAAYGIARDDGSPLTMQRWLLLYAASDRAPAPVLCERPATALPVAPPARCRDTFVASGLVDPLTGAPVIGRAALPTSAATFADAIDRWETVRGVEGEEVTFAVYRAWDEDGGPLLAVGAGVPMPLTPADSDVGGSADHVALELATGRTLAAVQVEQAGEALGEAPLGTVGPSTLQVADAPFIAPESIPLVVAGGVGFLLLALLGLLLYSRLVRARVLDSATRAAILDIVGAEPGLHASGVRDRLGKRGGVTDHHLNVLVREGFLTALVTPGFRRYFVTGKHAPHEMRAIAALREGQNEKLLHIIRANPGIPLQTLALEAGVSVPFASRSIQRLAEAGLVEKVQVGRALTLHAAEG